MKVQLQHTTLGTIKEVKVGFSWTTLFFGGVVPLIRGDIREFVKWLYLPFLTFGIWALIQPFTINKKYVQWLISKEGYTPNSENDRNKLVMKDILG